MRDYKFYICVCVINLIYIFASIWGIDKLYDDSHSFFVAMFLFLFGIIAQKLISLIPEVRRDSLQAIVGFVISTILLTSLGLLLSITFFGILGAIESTMDHGTLYLSYSSSIFNSTIRVQYFLLCRIIVIISIFFNIVELINAKPSTPEYRYAMRSIK